MEKKRAKRIDAGKRFPLRMDANDYQECAVLSFQRCSANLLFNEMIQFCLNNDYFMEQLKSKYPRDERRGHFTYFKNT